MDTVPMTFDRAPETRWNNRESVFVQFDVARSRPHPGSNPNLLKTTTKLKHSSAIGPACTEPFHSRQRFSQAGLAEAHAYHHTAPRLALRIESANATSFDPRSSFMKAGTFSGLFRGRILFQTLPKLVLGQAGLPVDIPAALHRAGATFALR